MKLDEKTAEAVVRLQNNPDFKIILEAVKAYRHKCIDSTLYGQPDSVQTSRGMARATTEVLRGLSNAQETLKQLRERSKRNGRTS